MNDVMQFPETWEEFEASYGFTDREEVYTNGARLIPSFRVEQWLEHTDPVKHGEWIPCSEKLPEKPGRYLTTCSKWGAWEVDWNIWVNEPKPYWLWEQGVTAWMPLPEPYKEK